MTSIRTNSGNLVVEEPSPNDIICGRGRAFTLNRANLIFSNVVRAAIPAYKRATKRVDKSFIVSSVVSKLKEDHGLRFVKQDRKNGFFYVLTDERAHEKTGHAIRDLMKIQENPDARREKRSKQRRDRLSKKNDDDSSSAAESSSSQPTPVREAQKAGLGQGKIPQVPVPQASSVNIFGSTGSNYFYNVPIAYPYGIADSLIRSHPQVQLPVSLSLSLGISPTLSSPNPIVSEHAIAAAALHGLKLQSKSLGATSVPPASGRDADSAAVSESSRSASPVSPMDDDASFVFTPASQSDRNSFEKELPRETLDQLVSKAFVSGRDDWVDRPAGLGRSRRFSAAAVLGMKRRLTPAQAKFLALETGDSLGSNPVRSPGDVREIFKINKVSGEL